MPEEAPSQDPLLRGAGARSARLTSDLRIAVGSRHLLRRPILLDGQRERGRRIAAGRRGRRWRLLPSRCAGTPRVSS